MTMLEAKLYNHNLSQWKQDVLVVSFSVLIGVGLRFFSIDFSLTQLAKQAPLGNIYVLGFIITLIGNGSILLPIAYAAAIPILSSSLQSFTYQILLGLICGVGGGIGEMTAYGLGYLGRKKLSEASVANFRKFEEKIGRSKPLLVFIAGATPIPDEFIVVPLASGGYPLRKMVIFSIFGKMLLCIFLSAVIGPLWELGLNMAGQSGVPFCVITPAFILLFYLFTRIEWKNHIRLK